MNQIACETLADRIQVKRDSGLVDVKFYLRNVEEVSAETVCREVLELYDAMDRGEYTVLDFNDLRWPKA